MHEREELRGDARVPGHQAHAGFVGELGGGRRNRRRRRRRRRRARARLRFGDRRVDPVARGYGPGDRAGERVPARGDDFGKRGDRDDHRDERAREHRLARGGGVLAESPSAGGRRGPVPTGGHAAVRRVPADAVQEPNLLLRQRRAAHRALGVRGGAPPRARSQRVLIFSGRETRGGQKAAVPRVARVRPQAVVRVPQRQSPPGGRRHPIRPLPPKIPHGAVPARPEVSRARGATVFL